MQSSCQVKYIRCYHHYNNRNFLGQIKCHVINSVMIRQNVYIHFEVDKYNIDYFIKTLKYHIEWTKMYIKCIKCYVYIWN